MREYMFYFKSALLVSAFCLLPEIVFATEDEAFTESVVIFNTICAKCHEAQCSGRLSFDDSFEASVNHIVRYYGEASEKKWLQRELFVILNHMKEQCAYYPMPTPIPPQRVWSGEMLEKMAMLVERNYFIPIGSFTPGRYQLELKLAKDAKVTVHLVSETFDMVVEDCYFSSDRRIVVPFSIEEGGNHYVRIYPRKPVQITRLAITPLAQSSVILEEDDSYVIVEVKGEHKLEDPIVKAKQEFAEQIAVASGMQYKIIGGQEA
jgi:hypothetical protein